MDVTVGVIVGVGVDVRVGVGLVPPSFPSQAITRSSDTRMTARAFMLTAQADRNL